MRVTFYVGEPGTGKTTLMRVILNEYRMVEPDEFVEDGPVKYHRFNKQKTLVLGIYDNSTFAGCDRLSKSVGPKFRQWLIDNAEKYKDWGLLMEGERFMNAPSLEALFQQEAINLVCLKVSEEELERRRAARNNTQDPKWMKGMRTRVENVCKNYPHSIEVIG
jgi:deoxyadenosine/deoxycytidine kinase